MIFTSWCAEARRHVVPGAAAALFAATSAFAQAPSAEDIEQARERLRLGLGARNLPPAAYDETPVPVFVLPDGEPHVLPPPPSAARALMPDLPDGDAATSAPVSDSGPPEADTGPALPAESPPPAPQPAEEPPTDVAKPSEEPQQTPPEPALAREEPEPGDLKTGRAATAAPETQPDVPPKSSKPPKPTPAAPRPVLTLPEALRP